MAESLAGAFGEGSGGLAKAVWPQAAGSAFEGLVEGGDGWKDSR
jgi:hypothetical protein